MSASAAVPAAGAGGFDLMRWIRTAPTPLRLRGLLVLVWGLALVLFLVGEETLVAESTAMRTVGKDAAPSIIAAQDINYALADLDANAGNYLLGNRGHQEAAMRAFEKRRTDLTASLLSAAQNITYGDAEKVPIGQLFEGLGRYLELVSQMRFQKDQGDAQGALVTYGDATNLMHQRLVPAGDALDKANRGYLDRGYEDEQAESEGAVRTAGGAGAAVLVALLAAQIYLFRRTRRILSLPLVAATIVCAGFTFYLVGRLDDAHHDLKVATKDAFDSIHMLSKARAIAGDANGDETRWLLFGKDAAKFEQAYRDKVKLLATVAEPPDAMITATPPPKQYQGLFADEMRNITFAGEREAALKMIRAFSAYDAIDGKIRSLERAGKHDAAVEMCIGSGAGQSNAAFDEFGEALHKVITINRTAFDFTVKRGMDDLALAEKLMPIACLAIALLAFLGIRPRLREYAA